MKGMQEMVGKVGEMFEPDSSGKRDVVSILKADHRKVEMLFTQFESARTSSKKQQLVDEIIKELTIHATCEEDLVYPLLEDSSQKKTSEKTAEAEEEHHILKMALAELADIPATSPLIKAKVAVIKEMVRHHVKEEESQLLPALKRSGNDLERIGTQVMERKQQLMADVSRGGGIGKNKNRTARATTSRSKSIGKSTAKPVAGRRVADKRPITKNQIKRAS